MSRFPTTLAASAALFTAFATTALLADTTLLSVSTATRAGSHAQERGSP